MNSPFFSVCIEVNNRAKTITKVLQAIQNQTCRDFELIIVDNGSCDESVYLIEKEIANFHDIRVLFCKDTKPQNEIEGWNRPLRFATGEFIAICEGDDYFLPTHLEVAKRNLELEADVGIYVAGSKLREFNHSTKVSTHESKLKELKFFDWCPPPSTVIFRRLSRTKSPYLFDESFIWAGEYSLYYEILRDGFNVVENFRANFIERGFRHYTKTSFHMEDMLRMRESDRFHYTMREGKIVDTKIAMHALSLIIFQIAFMKFEKRLFRIFVEYFYRGGRDYEALLAQFIKGVHSAFQLRIHLLKNQ